MIYALILTVFLGTASNNVPLVTEVLFKTAEACEKALDTASFVTPLPYVKATASCEKRPTT